MTSLASAGLLRAAAICSFVSVATTLTLIFGPDFYAPVPEGLAGRMQRVEDPAYLFRAWVYLVHPFIVLTAFAGMAAALWRRAPVLVTAALAGVWLWASTEAGQQMLTLFAFDDWRRAWLAGDEAVRASMDVRAAVYDGLWDAAYGLLLIGFTIGNTLFGAVLIRGGAFDKTIAGFLFAAAALSVVYFAQEIVGGPLLPGGVGDWIYPAIQPLGRTLIGVWLWRCAARVGRAAI